MQQHKEYPIIQIDDGFVMVDKEININNDSDWTMCNTVSGKKWIYKPATFHKDKNLNYDPDYWKIISHTGIESLKNSNLPLFEMPDDPMVLAREAAVMNNYDIGDDVFKHGFVLGYRKSGGYTEEDIRNAFRAGGNYENEYNYPDAPDEDEYIKSLKKYPISAEVFGTMSMRKNDNGEDIGFPVHEPFIPKVDQNNHLIIKQFNYE